MTPSATQPADGFGLDHLPYGAFSTDGSAPRLGVRFGDQVLDLAAFADATGAGWKDLVGGGTLNPLLAAGPEAWALVRSDVQEHLSSAADSPHLVPLTGVTLHLPFEVADYVDFYASENHASNVGSIFRPDGDALTPNWKHLPIGYHGRSSTVVVSGTPVRRPVGQRKTPKDPEPLFGPSVKLDIEAELGFVVGGSTQPGERVDIENADQHLFGVALFNDWSARDIQAWEYVPLGPFLGKSFASSIAAWITPMAALTEAKIPLPAQDPTPLDYLRGSADASYGLDIAVEVELNGEVIGRPPYPTMYWSPAQMLAHLSVNGAAVSPGDLFASGTISGTEADTRGSLLELTWNGTEPLTLADGSTRSFLEDGDTVTIRATAPGPGGSTITLGEVTGTITPAT